MRAKSMQMGGAESFEHVQKPATAIQDHVSSPNNIYNGFALCIRPITDLWDCQMYIQMYESRLVSAQLILSNIKNIPTQLCKSPLQMYYHLQKCLIYFIVGKGTVIQYQLFMCLLHVVRSLGHVVWNQTYIMVVFHDIWYMCYVYISNFQHHIETAIVNAARKEILVFHNREQLHVRLSQACTFETKRRVLSRSKLFGT